MKIALDRSVSAAREVSKWLSKKDHGSRTAIAHLQEDNS
jgi:hypothetical protein